MKQLKSLLQNKRKKILSFPTLTLVFLLALLPLGFWVRYQSFVINGGLSQSYIDWAVVNNYFGGITPVYVQGADEILHLRPWPTTLYPPGYSLFIALWKLFGINNLQTIRLVQAAVDCLTVFPIFYVLSRLGVRQIISLCAAGVYAVVPLWAFGSVMLLAEALSPTLMAWLLALMVFASSRRQMILWLATGFYVALLALIRPDLILFIGPLLLWSFFTAPAERRIQAVTITIVGFCSLMFLWGVHNKVHNGHWIFTSSAGSYALWSGLGQLPNDYGYFVDDTKAGHLLIEQGIIGWHSTQASNYWGAAYKNAWREHPDYVLKTIFWRISKIPFDHQSYIVPREHDLEGIDRYFTKYGFFVLCLSIIPLVIQRKFSTAFIISLPLLYALGSLGLVYYESRYIRYVPLSYIFAAAIAINFLYSRFVSLSPLLRKRAVSLGLAVFALIVIGSYATRNMLVLSEEATKAVLANQIQNQMRLALAEGGTKLIATLTNFRWTPVVPGVSFEIETNAQLRVKTSQGTSEYQLITSIDVSHLSSVHVEYDIHVDDGGMALGLLLPDGSRFIGTSILRKAGDNIGSLTVVVKGLKSLSLVLMNSREEDGQSHFVVRKLNIQAI
jgi:hypothetical protein